jgi:thymidylate kinase
MNFDKQQILFVVGPDMSGKTNIAKAIVAETGFAYFKASSEHGTYLKSKNRFIDQLRHADPRVADFMKQTGVNVIMDRGFPCEYAYSKVLGRRTDKKMIKMMDEAYASLGSKILFCHRSSYEGIIDDIDSKLDAQKLQLIHEAYEEFFKMSKCSVHHLNVDDEDLKREVDEAIGFMIS